jgi:hypothetical protein
METSKDLSSLSSLLPFFSSSPNPTEGWEKFVETHGFNIFRRSLSHPSSSAASQHGASASHLYEYLTCGTMEEIELPTLKRVFCDYEFRKKWDTYLESWKSFQEEGDEKKKGDEIFYYCTKYPFPMSKRDYVFKRRMYHKKPEENG